MSIRPGQAGEADRAKRGGGGPAASRRSAARCLIALAVARNVKPRVALNVPKAPSTALRAVPLPHSAALRGGGSRTRLTSPGKR